MPLPDLKTLRAQFRQQLVLPLSSGWSVLDVIALVVAIAVTLGVQLHIRSEFPFTGFGERMLMLVLSFVATATTVYAIWYLPLITIAVLRRYWWALLLTFAVFVAWANLRASL